MQWTQVETEEITVRYIKNQSDQILELVAEKSCEISFVEKKAKFTLERV